METIQKVAVVLLIPLLAFLIWNLAILTDSYMDTNTCQKEFEDIVWKVSNPYAFDSAFANDDFFNRRNGQEIKILEIKCQ